MGLSGCKEQWVPISLDVEQPGVHARIRARRHNAIPFIQHKTVSVDQHSYCYAFTLNLNTLSRV